MLRKLSSRGPQQGKAGRQIPHFPLDAASVSSQWEVRNLPIGVVFVILYPGLLIETVFATAAGRRCSIMRKYRRGAVSKAHDDDKLQTFVIYARDMALPVS